MNVYLVVFTYIHTTSYLYFYIFLSSNGRGRTCYKNFIFGLEIIFTLQYDSSADVNLFCDLTTQVVFGKHIHLHQCIYGVARYTALVVLVARHPDVTIHAPTLAPTVSDNPIISAGRFDRFYFHGRCGFGCFLSTGK